MFHSTQFSFRVPSLQSQVCFILLNLVITSTTWGFQSSESDLTEKVTPAQREIIQRLTGQSPVMGGRYLGIRSTPEQRQWSADYLHAELLNAGLNAQRHQYKRSYEIFVLNLFLAPMSGTNVYAEVPATTDANEYVIVGAHYDTEPGSPGANDNATGVAAVMALAQQINQLQVREKHFMFVFFDQEEDDATGSKAFAEMIQEKGLKVHSVHTIDMLGWDADGDEAIEIELPTEELKALYEAAASQLQIPIRTTSVSSSDHSSFRNLGYPAIGITEEYANGDSTPHYHLPTDTVDTVNFDYLANGTQLIWTVLKALAKNHNLNP